MEISDIEEVWCTPGMTEREDRSQDVETTLSPSITTFKSGISVPGEKSFDGNIVRRESPVADMSMTDFFRMVSPSKGFRISQNTFSSSVNGNRSDCRVSSTIKLSAKQALQRD